MAEQDWSTALSDYVEGTQDCTEGANNYNATLLQQGVQQLTAANGEVADIVDLVGSAATTTTASG